jgi:hypothetical protein
MTADAQTSEKCAGSTSTTVGLIAVAAFGLLVPGMLSLYAFLHDYPSFAAAFSNRLALAFFIDLVVSTLLLACLFARRPLGPVGWPWFVALSFLGTLAFSIPIFFWLNWRRAPAPRPGFWEWLRTL